MLTNDDPRLAVISTVIRSAAAIKAMVLATGRGEAALCGVDKLLCLTPGSDYQTDERVRREAGFRVGEQMKEMGFVAFDDKSLPEGCIAMTGKVYRFLEH